MSMPLWFSNLLFWSAQVALLALAAAFLPRLFQIRQPRVLLAYWRGLLAISLRVTPGDPALASPAGRRRNRFRSGYRSCRRPPSIQPRGFALEFSQPRNHRSDFRCRDSCGNRHTIRIPCSGTLETSPAPPRHLLLLSLPTGSPRRFSKKCASRVNTSAEDSASLPMWIRQSLLVSSPQSFFFPNASHP